MNDIVNNIVSQYNINVTQNGDKCPDCPVISHRYFQYMIHTTTFCNFQDNPESGQNNILLLPTEPGRECGGQIGRAHV